MPDVLEIEGDLVRHIRREVIATSHLKDIVQHIETRLPTVSPVLPDRTKLYALDPSDNDNWRLSVLIQVDPHVRTITMADGEWRGTAGATARIAIPYSIFTFHMNSRDQGRNWAIEDQSCWFSKEPINTGKEVLTPALLPNVFDDGKICFGNTAPTLRAESAMAERLNAAVNTFYITNFTDIGHTRERYLPYGARKRDMKPWIEATATNPRCWETWPELTRDHTEQQHKTAEDALLRENTERVTPIVLANGIPPIPTTPTFGRTDEWLRGLTDIQRGRIKRALAAIETENHRLIGRVPANDADLD